MASKGKGKLNLLIVTDLQGRGIKEAIRDTKKLGKQMDSLAGSALKAAAGFAAFKVGGMLSSFGKEALTSATELERGVAGLGAIFREQAPAMIEFAKEASQIGLSMTEAASASTFLGSVIKQAGFSIDETAEMTQRLINLSADLAITYQRDVQEALTAIAALFRGEYDPIEKFGVGMKQNEIESIKAARGLDKLTGRAEIFADVMIRMEQLFERSTDAQGAFQRQSETLFATQQILAAEFKNMQSAVGLALTPAFAELTANIIPLVKELVPLMIAIFKSVIPVIQALVANKEQLKNTVFGVIATLATFIKIIAAITQHVIKHIEVYKYLAIAFGVLVAGVKMWGLMTTAINVAANAVLLLNGRLLTTIKRLNLTRAAIARTGFGLIALAVGSAAVALGVASDDIQDSADAMADSFEDVDFDALMEASAAAQVPLEDLSDTMTDVAGSAGQAADAVGDFYRKLADSAAKQSAKLQLQAMGASEGLIDAVLGSGEEWYKVFADVTRNGLESLREVQGMFLQTQEGFDEAMQKWQEEFDAFQEFKKQAYEAKDALVEFVTEFQVLPTIERQLGRFEQSAVDQLASIEEKLDDAFDNGYLLQESYRNLQTYARQEFAVLRQIERQRDEILARRDAAASLIASVSESVRSGAQLVNVLQNVQNETENVDVARVVKKTIEDAAGLREFEVIVTSAVIEPIEAVVSNSQKLVSGYRDIVERTRTFVQNMKELRALGLDPQLFNELVEAGVDAGGATAQALIEGGADTVNEVNNLFGELNALGEELGEETAQVMYGQGENFVDGIVKGLEAQAQSLEDQAKALAETFTTTFEDILISGIEAAIAAAEAALAKMPKFTGQPDIQRGTPDTGGANGRGLDPNKPLGEQIGFEPPKAINLPKLPGGANLQRPKLPTVQMRPTITSGASNWRPASYTYVTVNNNKVDTRSVNQVLSKLYTSSGSPTSLGNVYLGR